MSEHIIFYDIASQQPLRTFAPNPWKTRQALNLKGVPYRTEWLEMPDIAPLREKLGVPANRTLPDGTPYHTLPVIQDLSTGEIIGDSFEIALYLDRVYPERAPLFRPLTTGLTAAFNAQVDGLFTKFAVLNDQMPITDIAKEVFVQRHGAKSWDDMKFPDEDREGLFVSFEAALGELAKAYKHTGGTTDHVWRAGGTDKAQAQRPPPGQEEAGPFLDGDAPVYSDFIVGAWLKMSKASLRQEDWQRVSSWQGGLWQRVLDGLEKWSEIK
ncbi:hypothetical protein FH972_021093 [Carpinus fangiana]|uniref:GST N-terminal domain-containing protein n=1 Tax=Carpinus fangiana TaxID=176857 RepID=A0A5N6KNI6_9ROSI|nr:hypothetical protein FH972_021093 [Carpinus fangiana]